MDRQIESAAKWFGGSLVASALVLSIGLYAAVGRFEETMVRSTTTLANGLERAAASSRAHAFPRHTLDGEVSLNLKTLTIRMEESN